MFVQLFMKFRNIIVCVACIVGIALSVAFLGDDVWNYKGYINTYATALTELNTVIIDAGHGGEDPGAVGVDGVLEKNLNLSIALTLGEMLADEGFAVVYTRTEDKMLYAEGENIKGLRKINDLKNRCKIAAEYESAMLVSIHMNSFSESKYSGFQAYYSINNNESKQLACNVQRSVSEILQPTNTRTEKSGKGLYLLDKTSNTAVLLECGFLSNPEECKKLSEKEYQKQLSLAIVCGIIEYKENINQVY